MNIIKWIYQLPQNLLGMILSYNKIKVHSLNGVSIYLTHIGESMSIGEYIFINPSLSDGIILRHEYGHTIQSRILGPLYLFIIFIPSFLWCYIFHNLTNKDYYWFYTEIWANKLAFKNNE